MRDSIKLNDEIPVCVAVTVHDLQVAKSKISDSMSALLSQETNLLGDHYLLHLLDVILAYSLTAFEGIFIGPVCFFCI